MYFRNLSRLLKTLTKKQTLQCINIWGLVCLGMLITGCVAPRVQTVENQIYHSTHSPTLKAEIREDLSYIGRSDSKLIRTAPDFAGGIDLEVIAFGQYDEKHIIDKGLFFISETLTESDARFILRGCESVDKDDYFYNGYISDGFTRKCRIVSLTNGNYGNSLLSGHEGNDKKFQGTYLFEEIMWITSAEQTSFSVLYLEKIPTYSHSQWWSTDETMLTADERERYQTFLENAKTAYKKLP